MPRGARPRAPRPFVQGADGGQLLLLAGIVLVMAFVVTAFTLSQVADVEKQAAQEQQQSFLTEYRFLHTKLPSILAGNTGATTDNTSFNGTFNATVTSFRTTLASKGYDASIYLAANASGAPKSECMYTTTPCQPGNPGGQVWAPLTPIGGAAPFDDSLAYDGVSDGVLWMCGQQDGAIVGAVVHLFLSDGRTSLTETIVLAVNAEWYDSIDHVGCPGP